MINQSATRRVTIDNKRSTRPDRVPDRETSQSTSYTLNSLRFFMSASATIRSPFVGPLSSFHSLVPTRTGRRAGKSIIQMLLRVSSNGLNA